MAKIALYRKYRPSNFNEIVGQEHVQKILKNSVKDGRFSHAYLFCGPRGVGKTSVARILAKAINCQQPKDGNPCNQCDFCRTINEQTSLDVIEIDAASNRGIDEIRDLREKIKFGPSELKYKVFIIDEVHMLTKEAFNALLKTLEEPPAHAIFILATTEIHKIPATVISRCQRFDFKRISNDELKKRILKIAAAEEIKLQEEAAILIAKTSEGGMRDAISIFDQISTNYTDQEISIEEIKDVLGIVGEESTNTLSELIKVKDKKGTLEYIDSLVSKGADINQLTKNLLEYFRTLIHDEIEETEASSHLEAVEILSECSRNFRYSTFPQLALEVSLLKIINLNQDERPINPEKTVKQETPKAVSKTKKSEVKNIDDYEKKWSQVLYEVKDKNLSVHALLKVAHPTFSDKELILTFPFKFHRERVDDYKNRRLVEAAVKKIYSKELTVVCRLGNGREHSSEIIEEEPQKVKKEDVKKTEENILDIFGGKIIE